MSLIDITYFEDADLVIPGLDAEWNTDELTELISKYEPEYLKAILGYACWKAFDAGLTASTARWVALRDGDEYTDASGVLRKWDGFKNDELKSPIANYVYYYWLRKNGTTTTVSGEKESKTEKSVNVSSVHKQVRAWNEMVRMNGRLVDFLQNKKDESGELVYPEFKAEELSGSFYNLMCKISGL